MGGESVLAWLHAWSLWLHAHRWEFLAWGQGHWRFLLWAVGGLWGAILCWQVGVFSGRGLFLGRGWFSGRTARDARWASWRDLRRARLRGTTGIVVGRIGRHILRYSGVAHVFVVAATQTGKTRSLVSSTLLEPHPSTSLIVFDPKGELYDRTAAYRATVSRVIKLALCTDDTDCYNPFDAVRLGMPHEVADLQLLGEMLVNPSGITYTHEGSIHFLHLTAIALRGLVCYGLRTMPGFALGDLFLLITQGHLLDTLKQMQADTHPLVRQAGALADLDTVTFRNVHATLLRTVELYADPFMADMTTKSDFALSDLRQGPQPLTIYLSVPFQHLERTRSFTNLVLWQLLSHATAVPSSWRRQGYWKVLAMGEEFPSLGRLEIAARTLNHGAGLGVQLCVIAPSLNTIEEVWGIHHNFLETSHVQVYFGITDEKVAGRISRRIGERTVRDTQVSWHPKWGRTVTYSTRKQPLMSSSDVTHMHEDEVLILARKYQVIAQQAPWDQWKPWRSRGTEEAHALTATP